jgi:PHD/YefM family antitoxin component YafN of YafNO toxin-antitoxin module
MSATVKETVPAYSVSVADLSHPMILEHDGRPVAALISIEEYNRYQELQREYQRISARAAHRRSKPAPTGVRIEVRSILRAAGMLYEPGWEMPPAVSSQKRARLAQKLAQGRPLSEVIIEEREDRA